jgi:hypothetical protein
MMNTITISELKENLLAHGPVTFQFLKKDNTMRMVIGTLNDSIIPEEFHPKKQSITDFSETPKSLRFFDLEKKEWRSISYSCNSMINLFE